MNEIKSETDKLTIIIYNIEFEYIVVRHVGSFVCITCDISFTH